MNNVFIYLADQDKDKVSPIVEYIESIGYSVLLSSQKDDDLDLLQKSDLFIYISSNESNSSTECATAVGLAVEQGKSIYVICIDQSPYNEAVLINLITAISLPFGLNKEDFDCRLKYDLSFFLGEIIPKGIPIVREKNADIIKLPYAAQNAAKKGDIKSLYDLGLYYERLDRAQSNKYLREAADKGYMLAALRLYQRSVESDKGKLDELDSFSSSLISSNDPEAIYQMGEWFSHSDDIQFNYEKCLEIYKTAATIGNCNAGKRVSEYDTLKRFFEQFEQGDVSAAFKIGLEYEKGGNVEQDTTEALSWFERASKAGYMHASHHIACMYEYGTGCKADFANAKHYHTLAAKQGHKYSSIHSKELQVAEHSDVVILKDGVYYDPKYKDIIDLSKYDDTRKYTVAFGIGSLIISLIIALLLIASKSSTVAYVCPILLLTFSAYSIISIYKRRRYALFYIRLCMVLQLIASIFTTWWILFFSIGALIWAFKSSEIKELFPKGYRKTSLIDYVVCFLVLYLMLYTLVY